MKNETIKILHLEDTSSDAELIHRALKNGEVEYQIRVVETQIDFEKELVRFKPHLILSDHTLQASNSLEAMEVLKRSGLKIPFILVTGHESEDHVTKLVAEGMDGYVLKNNLQQLLAVVTNVLERYSLLKATGTK